MNINASNGDISMTESSIILYSNWLKYVICPIKQAEDQQRILLPFNEQTSTERLS